ncbi:NAD(P)H-quinone oxidoreductase subunit S chloroplastic [Quillaja saponaria]|uniref:NAD(P)H-quinone oxidoreductase subunit S chloroplastic n=1 Tax=Quillaja saponaria TaxID=32244 RepID=A0AAD7KS44_QUISA|nr:NAD(P)H-quinone oxidoreductase subunit S chloroplastic [Quillaja saponaria]
MATFVNLPSLQLQGPLLRSHCFGINHLNHHPSKQSFPVHKSTKNHFFKPRANFNLSEILGGRGICNGEQGLQEELRRKVDDDPTPVIDKDKEKEKENSGGSAPITVDNVPEDAFEKELMGLTGGFPGGEIGLNKFIEENPPPKKPSSTAGTSEITDLETSKKPKPPELPLLMPGMIAIVKNPNNPYYMYCGIVQRITDGKAWVLVEGGNWDRLITFRLEELERREKGPPMKNPKSDVLEPFLEKES